MIDITLEQRERDILTPVHPHGRTARTLKTQKPKATQAELDALVERRLLENHARGCYRLTDHGRAAIGAPC